MYGYEKYFSTSNYGNSYINTPLTITKDVKIGDDGYPSSLKVDINGVLNIRGSNSFQNNTYTGVDGDRIILKETSTYPASLRIGVNSLYYSTPIGMSHIFCSGGLPRFSVSSGNAYSYGHLGCASNLFVSGVIETPDRVIATNIISKIPFKFIPSNQTTINGVSVYKYDLDISKYVNSFDDSGDFILKYFKITTFWNRMVGNVFNKNEDYVSQTILLNYYKVSQITFGYSPDSRGSDYMLFTNKNSIYWICNNNNFNYITFISTDNHYMSTFYVFLEDYLQ